MNEYAARLVDEVRPRSPVRQWVLRVPYRLRQLLAWNHALARAAGTCGCCWTALLLPLLRNRLTERVTRLSK